MISGISGYSSSLSMMQSATPSQPPDPQELFAKIDSDGNGALSRDEVSAFDEQMAKAGRGRGVDNVFADLDTDGDDSISADEFAAGAPKGPRGGGGPQGPPPPPPGGSEEDEDDSVSLSLMSLMQSLESDSEASSSTNSLDVNGDGTVDSSDFAQLLEQLKSSDLTSFLQNGTAASGSGSSFTA